MTEFSTQTIEVETMPSDHAEPTPSPVLAALTKNARRNFKPARIARDAARIEELGAIAKAPSYETPEYLDAIYEISHVLTPYGLDVSLRIETSLVSRKHERAWAVLNR